MGDTSYALLLDENDDVVDMIASSLACCFECFFDGDAMCVLVSVSGFTSLT